MFLREIEPVINLKKKDRIVHLHRSYKHLRTVW